MAKFSEASEHISDMFENYRKESMIPLFVEIRYLQCPTQKVLYKISKLNPMLEVITEGVNLTVCVNEEVFDQLSESQQKIAISECFAGVTVSDSDIVSVEPPKFTTHPSTIKKFGGEEVINMKETVDLTFKQMKEKAEEAKANAEPKKRGRKRK